MHVNSKIPITFLLSISKKSKNLFQQHLEETECLVVAHKNKLEYIETMNEDLRLLNGKLKEEIRTLENMMKLPNHPVIEKIRSELKEER